MRTSHLLRLAAFASLTLTACTRPLHPSHGPPVTPEPPRPGACTSSLDCPQGDACELGTCTACTACGPDTACAANETCTTHGNGCTRCAPATTTTPPQTDPATEPPPTTPPPQADPKASLLAMEAAYSTVRDYTATMTRRERVKGKLLPQETMQVKFRKPFSIYTRWTGSVHKGREVLYIRGKNGNKLRAHQGSFPDVTVDIDPRGGLAMKGNRHPITEGSLGDLIGLLVRDLRRAESRPQDGALIKDLGESERHGQQVRCFDATFAVADGYYAPHVQVCMFTATSLPSRVQVWDAREQLVEDYEFRDLRTNVGLRDADFDSANPRYNF